MVALSEANGESGCMSMIPGSHEKMLAHKDTFGKDNILTRGQEVQNVDAGKAVETPLRPGQASFHCPTVIHGSQPNRSEHRRIGFAIQTYIPTNVKSIHGRASAQLVRGIDTFGHFDLLQRPKRDMEEAQVSTRSGDWKGWNPMQMLGTHVSGSTLGIIGMGRIGKAIAKRGNLGFEMPVLYYNRSEVSNEGLQNSHQVKSLDDLLINADIIVVSLPGSPETHHLIDNKSFEKMKSSSILINIARGEIVKESDLIVALKNKSIRGAGLDVYEFEPSVPKALIDLENVVLLPHLGTAALSVREKMGNLALENITAFLLDQKEPPNLIN